MHLSAVLLFFKEQHFLEATYASIYDHVDSICAVSQYDRNFSARPLVPDGSLEKLLSLPDPQNKLRILIQRDVSKCSGHNSEARLRNAAMHLVPEADYYLIVDSDEIWPHDVLAKCWNEVQKTQHSAYRVLSQCYFRSWNYQIVEKPPGYWPLVFLRKGFEFHTNRQIHWWGRARWGEYLRLGRKPKTTYLPRDWVMHHGSGVGDDQRILTKIGNYGHKEDVDPHWFENVWKNFSAETKNFHYFKGSGELYESIRPVATPDLPAEIRDRTWPEGWISR